MRNMFIALGIIAMAATAPRANDPSPTGIKPVRTLAELDREVENDLLLLRLRMDSVEAVAGDKTPSNVNEIRDLVATQVARCRDLLQHFKKAASSLADYRGELERLSEFLKYQIIDFQTKANASESNPRVHPYWTRNLELAQASLESCEARLCLLGFPDSPEHAMGKFPHAAGDLQGRIEALTSLDRLLEQASPVLYESEAIRTLTQRLAEFDQHDAILSEAIRNLISEVKPAKPKPSAPTPTLMMDVDLKDIDDVQPVERPVPAPSQSQPLRRPVIRYGR